MIVRLIVTVQETVLAILVKVDRVAFRLPSQRTRQPRISLMSQMEQATERLQEAHQQRVAGAAVVRQ